MREKEYNRKYSPQNKSCKTLRGKKGRDLASTREKERPWNPEKAQKVVEQRLKGNIEKTFALRYDKTEN
jgi:hypothetical protein